MGAIQDMEQSNKSNKVVQNNRATIIGKDIRGACWTIFRRLYEVWFKIEIRRYVIPEIGTMWHDPKYHDLFKLCKDIKMRTKKKNDK